MQRRLVEVLRTHGRNSDAAHSGALPSIFGDAGDDGLGRIFPRKTGIGARKRRQQFLPLIKAYKRIMSFSQSVRKWGVCLFVAVAAPALVSAQLIPQGTEYPLVGALPGDQ